MSGAFYHADRLRAHLELTETRLNGAEREIVRLRRENSEMRRLLSERTGRPPSGVLGLKIVGQNIRENIPGLENDQ